MKVYKFDVRLEDEGGYQMRQGYGIGKDLSGIHVRREEVAETEKLFILMNHEIIEDQSMETTTSWVSPCTAVIKLMAAHDQRLWVNQLPIKDSVMYGSN